MRRHTLDARLQHSNWTLRAMHRQQQERVPGVILQRE
jgi:hypothetical protein